MKHLVLILSLALGACTAATAQVSAPLETCACDEVLQVRYSSWEPAGAFDGTCAANAPLIAVTGDFDLQTRVEVRKPDGAGGFVRLAQGDVREAYVSFAPIAEQPDLTPLVPQADALFDPATGGPGPAEPCTICEGPPPAGGWTNCCPSEPSSNPRPGFGSGAEVRCRWLVRRVTLPAGSP